MASRIVMFSLLLHFNKGFKFTATSSSPLEDCLRIAIPFMFEPTDHLNFFVQPDFPMTSWPNTTMILDYETPLTHAETLRGNYVIQAADFNQLVFIIHNVTTSKVWPRSTGPRSKFLIILPNTKKLNDTLRYLWDLDIADVAVLTNKDSNFHLISGRMHNRNTNCGKKVTYTPVGICPDQITPHLGSPGAFNLHAASKFPKFPGCSFTASVVTKVLYAPFIGDIRSSKAGIAVEPMKLLSSKLAFNLILVVESDERQAFLLKSERILEVYKSRLLDTHLAKPLLMPEHLEYFDCTTSLYTDPYFWVVPKPGPLPNLKIMASVFTWTLWTTFALTLSTFTLLTYTSSKALNDKNFTPTVTFLTYWQFSFGIASAHLPKTSTNRLLASFYLILSIHFIYLYQGSLVLKLAKPASKPGIDSLEELADSNLPLVSYGEIHDMLSTINTSLSRKLHAKSSVARIGFGRVFDVAKFANTSTQIMKFYLDSNKALEGQVKILDGKYLPNVELHYEMRKGHPMLPHFNSLIRRFQEFGFTKKWLGDMRTVVFEAAAPEHLVLTVGHLQGAFVLLGLGLVLSLAVLLLEIFSKHSGFC